jgi:NAD(P)-dependent dehydrogenase (short-subunit alcohol dehydrogenase family)
LLQHYGDFAELTKYRCLCQYIVIAGLREWSAIMAVPGEPLLADRICVITGAASGVGAVSARLFAEHGAQVVLTDLPETKGADVCAQIAGRGGRATFMPADLADLGQIEEFARRCDALFPRVDVLFNNAAIVARDDVLDYDVEVWEKVMRVNATAPLHLTRQLFPLLARAAAASVINHSSIDGVYGNPWATSYSVSKAALDGITRMMAHTLGAAGVRANAICSGGATRSTTGESSVMSATLRADPGWARRVEQLAAKTPGGRSGSMEEVAEVALFLAADGSRHVNGLSLVVDGGRSAVTPGTV